MRVWRRSAKDEACGNCWPRIPIGVPFLEIQIKGLPVRRRCQACAGEPVPANVAPLQAPIVVRPSTPGLLPLAAALPFDYRMAAVGREPGSDDE